jgi:uncharacterized protein YhaN
MRIDGWHIDGYGVHHDLGVADLPEGLTVINGPNEAGKTTLQHFLVGMLFGFTATNRPDHHAPLRGGAYGGRLLVTDDEGQAFTIHRSARRSSLRVTGADGPVADPEAEVRRLLGGATKDLYQSLFAVHTDELDELRALTDDQVRDRVFSAGILGAGRTAQAALGQLSAERDELWKPGGRSAEKYLLKRLRTELADARGHLAEARREATGLTSLLHRIGVLEADREQAHATRAGLHDRRSLLFVVSNQWPTWAEAAEARGQLDQLGVVAPVPADAGATLAQLVERRDDLEVEAAESAAALAEATATSAALDRPGPALAHRDAIAELTRSLAVEQDRAATLPRLAAEVAQRDAELAATLAAIGPDTDEAWLDAHPVDPAAATTLRATAAAVHRAEDQLAAVRTGAERAAVELDEASTELEVREAAVAALPAHPVDRARRAVEAAAELVALLGHRDAVAHRLQVAQAPVPPAPAPTLPAYLVPTLAGAAGIAVLGGAVAAATSAPALGAVMVVLGLVLAGLALVARAATRVTATIAAPVVAPTDLAAELAALDRSLAPLLASFQLTSRPTLAEATNLKVRAEQLAAEAERTERERADAVERRSALDARRARLAQRQAADEATAVASVEAARAAWRAWLAEHDLPTALDASAAAEVLDAIGRARTLRHATKTARTAHGDAIAAQAAYAERVRTLLAATGLATDADPVAHPLAAAAELDLACHVAGSAHQAIAEAEVAVAAAKRHHDRARVRADQAAAELQRTIESLGAASLDDAREQIHRAELATELRRRITQADRDLLTSIGHDPARLDAARALLTRADPARWERELAEFDQQLKGIDAQIEELTTELAHLTRERDELERSADVATAELRVADLESQLVDAVTRWATLATAHRLVEDTLARYQRERQPDVVKRAAAHFALVTDGRYQRLEVREQEVVAIDHAEREVRADQLSKGATQQLYLCMRFALAESYARTTRLPLLLDDITVHADDGRLPRLADVVASVASSHQVFVFTSQEATVAQLRAASPDALRLITLAPSSAARRMGLAAG